MTSKTDELEQSKRVEIIKKIPQDIIIIRKLIKFSRLKLEQERIIALSKSSVYNLSKLKLKRTINVLTIQGISISSKSNQFTLHVPSEYDVRYKSQSRDQIIFHILKNRTMLGDLTRIPLFVVENDSLDSITTTEQDLKKGKRKAVQADHQMVNHITFGLYIYKQFNSQKESQILFVSQDHLSNCSQREYKKLMKIGNSPVCTTEILKCFKTNEIFTAKSLRKKYIDIDTDAFRNLVSNYKQCKYTEKLLLAKEKDSQFELFFEFCRGDMYGQLKTQGTINENFLLHICVRTLFAIRQYKYILKTICPENILLDNHGNPKFSLISSHLTVSSPDEYCSPEQIQFLLYQTPIKYPEMVNLWKLGITLFQLAYGVPPFPIIQLLSAVSSKRQLTLRFPRIRKSKQLQSFLSSILKLKPEDRLSFPNFNNVFSSKWFKAIDMRRYEDTPVHFEKYISKIEMEDNYSETIEYYHNF